LRPRLLDRLYPWLARAPRRAGELQAVFFGRGLARAAEPIFGHLPRWETTRALQRLFSPELRHTLAAADPIAELVAGLPPAIASWAPLDQSRLLEVETLLTSHLLCAQGDRQLQSQGVEGRFPYLDEQVIRGATGLSPGVLLPRLVDKRLLKVVAADRLPAKLVRRPKQPYRAPGAGCFVHGRGRELLAALTSPAALRAAGLFDPAAVARLVAKLTRPTPLPPSNSDEMALG